MANENIGFLSLGTSRLFNRTLQRPGFEPRQAGIRTDTYAFETGSITTNVAMSSRSTEDSPSARIDIALVVFQDNDQNGIINIGDTVVPGGNAGNGGIFQSLNVNLSRGHYVTRLTSVFDTDYQFRIARGTTGGANPLAAPEIQLGTIAQDLQRRSRVNDADTADNFAFTMGANDSLDIKVKELGNKAGDANIRVVQDLNSNGFVDDNEVIAKGVSAQKGNLDSISGFKGAGDYILQVCQSKGSTQFEVNFDHSTIAA
jgi:hypothetical protein